MFNRNAIIARLNYVLYYLLWRGALYGAVIFTGTFIVLVVVTVYVGYDSGLGAIAADWYFLLVGAIFGALGYGCYVARARIKHRYNAVVLPRQSMV